MFFTFRQNNSGGSFDFDEDRGISVNVIIEAPDAESANRIAEEKGLYFNGCSLGRDCSCCGDRWYRQWEDDGTEVPEIYGRQVGSVVATRDFAEAVTDDNSVYAWVDGAQGYIHYLNGDVVPCVEVD